MARRRVDRRRPAELVGAVIDPGRSLFTESMRAEAAGAVRAASLRRTIDLVHRGRYESVYVLDYLVVQEASAVVRRVVSFQVPALHVLELTALGVWYSEPFLNAGLYFGWRLAVDGQRVPGIGYASGDWAHGSYGGLHDPVELHPVAVQAGETVSVEVRDQTDPAEINERLTIAGLLRGRLSMLSGAEV